MLLKLKFFHITGNHFLTPPIHLINLHCRSQARVKEEGKMVACNMIIFFAGDTIGEKYVEESDPNSSSSRSSVVVPQYVAG